MINNTKQTVLFSEKQNDFMLEQFADIKIMRYTVPGFEDLSLNQKKLIYYLSEAANCGRDIIYDQFYKHNLTIRKTNEAIIESYKGDTSCQDFQNFLVYAKRVWFSNGIHHHYSTDKFFPEISQSYFSHLIENSKNALLPLMPHETVADFTSKILPIIFDKTIAPKRIVLDDKQDIVAASATNFYQDLTQKEVEYYMAQFKQPNPQQPLSVGLNSQLVKNDGKIVEKTYKVGGLYGKAIEKIIFWLEKAEKLAENELQKKSIQLLIAYYKTGDLKTWDDYNVAWVNDLNSQIDFVNGFIENYGDPLGIKATWESVVNFKNTEATKRTEIISANAQWFENHAPIDKRFKKKKVKGISAKVITVAQLGGDCYPTTPIGINLPNADWIRRVHGSKSVTMDNITYAYDKAAQCNGFLEEFCYSQQEIDLAKKHGTIASSLHTDLHECVGHGSGQLLPGVSSEALKNYAAVLEEARADLFALYYLGDKKMIELGLIESFDVCKTEYNAYIRNGFMTQLTRIELGKNIEQAHMRNRQLIAQWCFDKGKNDQIITLAKKNHKTYIIINSYTKLRTLFGKLLGEIQRIKSEGDFEAGKALVEKYAIKVNRTLHQEVITRYKKLHIAPYGGFVNPVFKAKYTNQEITAVNIDYSESYQEQMMRLSKQYSFL